jgi:putative ABC transport system permease protein
MGPLLRIIKDSVDQAFQQLRQNKLRSFLSLLGITIGIFCIISVKSAVDSLADNIKGSFEQLGSNTLYITKLPWTEDPSTNYWKYFQRPIPDIEDYDIIKERVQTAELVSMGLFLGVKTIKYRSNNVSGVYVFATTFEYGELFNLQIDRGRYFSPQEYVNGSNSIILGFSIAEELFGTIDPIGKHVKLMGRTMQVIGTVEKAGEALINPLDYDNIILISYNLARKIANVKPTENPWATTVYVKARDEVTVGELKDEVTGVLRAHRRLKPVESDNFSINEIAMITQILDQVFGVINIAGMFIGIFAILVGIFSVANIMFVSVKERTRFIGIKKAIGAKRYFILLEFLFEAVVLCILGGLSGLLLVILTLKILSVAINFEMYVSLQNLLIGAGLSIFIGILSGFIPAFQASKMDPVEAMRK